MPICLARLEQQAQFLVEDEERRPLAARRRLR